MGLGAEKREDVGVGSKSISPSPNTFRIPNPCPPSPFPPSSILFIKNAVCSEYSDFSDRACPINPISRTVLQCAASGVARTQGVHLELTAHKTISQFVPGDGHGTFSKSGLQESATERIQGGFVDGTIF